MAWPGHHGHSGIGLSRWVSHEVDMSWGGPEAFCGKGTILKWTQVSGVPGLSMQGSPSKTAKAEVGACWVSQALCTESTLTGQLKLKWMQASKSQGSVHRGELRRVAEAKRVQFREFQDFLYRGCFKGQLKLKQNRGWSFLGYPVEGYLTR